ncbi:hypothetical protein LMG33818_000045 [Halomonadaceae bacterium LMG 33818]|uniref:DUF4054 domain-containing protein n=1 Tax=Cernens ardua TaxID=3402176 RepID=UPI003EDC68CF
MTAVTFNPDEWRQSFPAFSGLSDAQLQMAWDVATTIVSNDDCSQVPYNPPNVTSRQTILYMLVAHIVALGVAGSPSSNSGSSSDGSSTNSSVGDGAQAGPITSASEGSVSVSFAVSGPDSSGSNAGWYNQTRYGQTVLRLLRPYMMGGRYYATRHIHPWG